MMSQQGITGNKVLRLYSERRPSDEWYRYFERHWPNVIVTWSFGPGEDAQFESCVEQILSAKQPWWRFW
jgi:hypothetical protein